MNELPPLDLLLPDIRISQDSQHLSAMVIGTADQTKIFLTYKDPSQVINIMYGFKDSELQWQWQNMSDEFESQTSTNLNKTYNFVNVDIRFISDCSFSQTNYGNFMYCLAKTTDNRVVYLGLRISFDTRGNFSFSLEGKLRTI